MSLSIRFTAFDNLSFNLRPDTNSAHTRELNNSKKAANLFSLFFSPSDLVYSDFICLYVGANRYYCMCLNDILALGGGGNFALCLDGDL